MSYFVDIEKLNSTVFYSGSKKYKVDPMSVKTKINNTWSGVFKNLEGYHSDLIIEVTPILIDLKESRCFRTLGEKKNDKRVLMFRVAICRGGTVFTDSRYFLPTGELTRVFRLSDYILGVRLKNFQIKENDLIQLLHEFNKDNDRLKNFVIEEVTDSTGKLISGYHGRDLISELMNFYKK